MDGRLEIERDFSVLVEATRGPQPWRRVFHAATGIFFAALLAMWQPTRVQASALLGATALGLLVFDAARLALPTVNERFFRLLRVLASPREARGIASSTWYVVGILVSVLLFPLDAVIPSILVLALADPAASYFGRKWGRRRVGKGSVEGVAVFIGVAVSVLLLSVPLGPTMAAAAATALVEVTPWSLDDNLTIPVTGALVLWMAGVGI